MMTYKALVDEEQIGIHFDIDVLSAVVVDILDDPITFNLLAMCEMYSQLVGNVLEGGMTQADGQVHLILDKPPSPWLPTTPHHPWRIFDYPTE